MALDIGGGILFVVMILVRNSVFLSDFYLPHFRICELGEWSIR